jgi:hypothetical protein
MGWLDLSVTGTTLGPCGENRSREHGLVERQQR